MPIGGVPTTRASTRPTRPRAGCCAQTNIGHTLGSAQEGANGFKVNGENKWYMFVDNYGSVASGARYGYNLLEADNLDSENPWSVLKADDYFLTANTKHGGVVSLTKAQYDAIRAADAKASDNADLKAEDVTVDKGAADTDITAKLPKTQQVTLANGYGTAKRDVTWDVSNVDTSKPGEYTVTRHGRHHRCQREPLEVDERRRRVEDRRGRPHQLRCEREQQLEADRWLCGQ